MMPRKSPSFPFRASVILGIAAAAIVVGYSFYAALPYLMGPGLSVTERTDRGLTTVSGRTARVSYLSIDGLPVPLQEDGSFTAVRAYPSGYTDITVSVKDRFGRMLEKHLAFTNN
jgi:hypothetical protein